jgi:hypothetical protein
MELDAFLATIILVSFLITIVMAVGSYGAYKLRERRRPTQDGGAAAVGGERPFFVRLDATSFDDDEPRGRGA